MATFLFAWNPIKWAWKDDELTKQILRIAETGSAADRWSCGNTQNIPPGSRCFLIRLGKDPRGIVGSGTITSEPERGPHWDPSLKKEGKEALFVNLDFDFLSKQPLIAWGELHEPPYAAVRWGIQASGVRLPDQVAEELEKLWCRRTGGMDPSLPDELQGIESYPEGARRTVVVNAYERNPQARAACIARYGPRCCVCDLVMEDRYGPIAAGFIHVHHIRPLSQTGESYRVNPVEDLRPMCPNCHAVVHRRQPPLSAEEARQLVRRGRDT